MWSMTEMALSRGARYCSRHLKAIIMPIPTFGKVDPIGQGETFRQKVPTRSKRLYFRMGAFRIKGRERPNGRVELFVPLCIEPE